MECERVLCRRAGLSRERAASRVTPQDLIGKRHDCLMQRYPGAREFVWTLVDAGRAAAIRGARAARVRRRRRADRLGAAGPRHHQQAALRGRRAPRHRRAGPGLRGDPAAADPARLPLSRTSGCRTPRGGCSSTSWWRRSARRWPRRWRRWGSTGGRGWLVRADVRGSSDLAQEGKPLKTTGAYLARSPFRQRLCEPCACRPTGARRPRHRAEAGLRGRRRPGRRGRRSRSARRPRRSRSSPPACSLNSRL